MTRILRTGFLPRSLLVALGCVVVAATGCGAQSVADSTKTTAASVATSTNPSGLSSSDLIVSATIVPAPTPDAYGIPRDSTWEDVVTNAATGPETSAAEWEAELIGQADRTTAAANAAAPLEGVTITQAGSVAGMGLIEQGPFESASPAADGPNVVLSTADLTVRVASGLQALGLTEVSLSFEQHKPLGPAPLVVGEWNGDPAQFVQQHPYAAEEIDVSGAPIFLEVVDSSGSPIEAIGLLPMSNMTVSWHSPSISGCFTLSCPTTADPGGSTG